MTSFDLKFARRDHFELFGLPRAYAVDAAELERLYRDVQARVHPDKHAHLSDAERRIAMQWATQVNEAYRTLRNPLLRARYLLELGGHDARIETNTAMPADFLMQQMELRETVADARAAGDAAQLDALHRQAGEIVRRLMFQEKLLAEIDTALEATEA